MPEIRRTIMNSFKDAQECQMFIMILKQKWSEFDADLKDNILLNSYRKQGKCAILEVKLDTKLRYRSKLCKAIIALVDTAH